MFRLRYHVAFPLARRAFTMVELLIVVAILAILVAVLLGVSSYITTQNNTALTRNCMDILDAAIGEFHAITGRYPVDDWIDNGGYMDAVGSLIDGAEAPGGPPGEDELLYLQLSLLPQTREIIAKLPEQLLAQSSVTVEIGGQPTPYLRSIVDAWGTPLNDDPGDPDDDTSDPYDVFPRLWSNGPDRTPRTEDDITK